MGAGLAACPTLSIFTLLKQGIEVRVHVYVQHIPIIIGPFTVAVFIDHFKVFTIAHRHGVSFLVHILNVGLIFSRVFPCCASFIIIQIQQGIGIVKIKLEVILRLYVIVQNGIFGAS